MIVVKEGTRGRLLAELDQADRLGYRPGLDGVRAIAVGLVMMRHLDKGFPSGAGAVGVTIFFALSGFLITTLLLEEAHRTGSISLTAFYFRRALRLFPALCSLLVPILLAGLIMGRRSWVEETIYAGSYMGNWAQILIGPFTPLAHTWSLAVEEHFYVLWPALFALIIARRPTRVQATMIVIGLASAAVALRLSLFVSGASALRLQYGTDTRLDGILVGCAAAIFFARRTWTPPPWLVVLGLVAIGAFIFVPPENALMLTGGFSLLALASIVLILAILPGTSSLARLLSTRALVAGGRISYGLYLWHLPVYLLLRPALSGLPDVARYLIVVSVSVAAAVSCYFLIERPFLRMKKSSLNQGGRVNRGVGVARSASAAAEARQDAEGTITVERH